jgi:hypothetical protein
VEARFTRSCGNSRLSPHTLTATAKSQPNKLVRLRRRLESGGMRFLAIAVIVVASIVGAGIALPVCPSTKRTPREKVAECIIAASAIGAIAGGALAAVPVTIIWLARRKPR